MKKQNVAGAGIAPIAGLLVLLAVVTLGTLYGLPLAVLGLATAALVLVVALLWASVSSLAGDTELSLDEALSYGAPSVEEEQKLAVLRALKDLEFERSVGKISEDDYREFSARYRAEAKRLITLVDESLGQAHKLAEALAAERIQKAAAQEPSTQAREERSDEDASAEKIDAPESASPKVAAALEASSETQPACPACQTINDVDARFCKHCGKTLKPEQSTPSSSEEKLA